MTARLGWGVLTLALALASLLTKSTAAVAGLVFVGAAGLLAWRGVQAWLGRRAWLALVAAGLGGGLVLGGLLTAGVDRQHTAAGWSYGIAVHADRRAVPDAHAGGWVLAPPADQPVASGWTCRPAIRRYNLTWPPGSARPNPARRNWRSRWTVPQSAAGRSTCRAGRPGRRS